MQHSVVADKGHTTSQGKSVIEFWLKCIVESLSTAAQNNSQASDSATAVEASVLAVQALQSEAIEPEGYTTSGAGFGVSGIDFDNSRHGDVSSAPGLMMTQADGDMDERRELDHEPIEHSGDTSGLEGAGITFEVQADNIMSEMDGAQSRLEELAALTRGLELSVSQLEFLVQEIPDDVQATVPRRRLDELKEAWLSFQNKPQQERSEEDCKSLMRLVMQIQREIRAAVSGGGKF